MDRCRDCRFFKECKKSKNKGQFACDDFKKRLTLQEYADINGVYTAQDRDKERYEYTLEPVIIGDMWIPAYDENSMKEITDETLPFDGNWKDSLCESKKSNMPDAGVIIAPLCGFYELKEGVDISLKQNKKMADLTSKILKGNNMKKRFKLEDYAKEYVAMHITNDKQDEIFRNLLYENGKKWASGESYLSHPVLNPYCNHSYLNFNMGCYEHKCESNPKITILEFDDFDWSEPKFKKGDRVYFKENKEPERAEYIIKFVYNDYMYELEELSGCSFSEEELEELSGCSFSEEELELASTDLYTELNQANDKVNELEARVVEAKDKVSNIENKIFNRIINEPKLNSKDLDYIISNSKEIDLEIDVQKGNCPTVNVENIRNVGEIKVVKNRLEILVKDVLSLSFSLKDAEINLRRVSSDASWGTGITYDFELEVLVANAIINIECSIRR